MTKKGSPNSSSTKRPSSTSHRSTLSTMTFERTNCFEASHWPSALSTIQSLCSYEDSRRCSDFTLLFNTFSFSSIYPSIPLLYPLLPTFRVGWWLFWHSIHGQWNTDACCTAISLHFNLSNKYQSYISVSLNDVSSVIYD